MPKKLFTFRGKFTGRVYYGTGFTQFQAARTIGIKLSHLILERSEIIPTQLSPETSAMKGNKK